MLSSARSRSVRVIWRRRSALMPGHIRRSVARSALLMSDRKVRPRACKGVSLCASSLVLVWKSISPIASTRVIFKNTNGGDHQIPAVCVSRDLFLGRVVVVGAGDAWVGLEGAV